MYFFRFKNFKKLFSLNLVYFIGFPRSGDKANVHDITKVK